MDPIITITCTILGILNIILFIKVWLMTNDVEKIKIHVLNSNIKTYDDIRKAYLKGDMYVAQDLLTEKLLNKLLKHKKNGKFNHVDSIIAEFEPTFINMGLEIPENVLRLKEDPADIIR